MDLKTFLEKANTTSTCLAKQVGVTPHYMAQVCRGMTKPSKLLAREIERYTRGLVTADEILDPWEIQKVNKQTENLKKFIEENSPALA